MTPKIIFATMGVGGAVASMIFVHPLILAAAVVSLGIAVIISPAQ